MNIDIKEYLNSRRFTVLWSGGKDSTATLLWILDNIHHEKWNIVYVEVTGNTHELCNKYIHETAKELGVHHKLKHVKREDMDFFECLKRSGIPLPGKNRWCLTKFKIEVWERFSNIIQVLGVRSRESRRRALIFRKFTVMKKYQEHKIAICPIFEWDKRRVIRYIREHEISVNPCYQIYGHSGNCMFCPNHRVFQIVRTLNDPVWGQKILDALLAQRGKNLQNLKTWIRFASQKTITSYFSS